MPNFKYKAISSDGAKVSGVISAYDEFEAVSIVKQKGHVVTSIKEVDGKKKFSLNMNIGSAKIKEKVLALMCSQFSIVLKAGMPIVRSVELIATQTADKPLRELLSKVAEDVATGYGLAQSFENKGEKALPVTFIETIRAGEQSGTLETSFAKLFDYYDKSAKLKAQVKSAMMYPIFLSGMAVVVIAIVMLVAMPVFLGMFQDMDMELPWPTSFLIGMTGFLAKWWVLIAAVVIALIIAIMTWTKTKTGKMWFAQALLKLPILGRVTQMRGASQFANTMTTMLAAGLSITNATAICSKVLDNYHLGTQLGAAVAILEEGKTLGYGLEKCGCFPDLLVEMTAVGEQTGSLENTLDTIGEYYDSETELASDNALKALQPIITVIMGAVIGFIVISLYLPMFTMYSGMA